MTDASFLRSICATPDDDTPRLVYADWLDEHGDPDRAEFIRVQCELAKGTDCSQCGVVGFGTREARMLACDCGFPVLFSRERKLLRHAAGWLPKEVRKETQHTWHPSEPVLYLHPNENRGAVSFEFAFRRGFVEGVACSAANWLTHGDAILAAQPVRKVRLTTCPKVQTEAEWTESGPGVPFVALWRFWVEGRSTVHTMAPEESSQLRSVYDDARWALEAEWPGIEFELTPAPVTIPMEWDEAPL